MLTALAMLLLGAREVGAQSPVCGFASPPVHELSLERGVNRSEPATAATISTVPVVSLQPGERGIRLQADWSGYRFSIAPEATSQNGFSLGGSLAGAWSPRAAVGVVFGVGAEKRELLVNASWWIDGSQRLFGSIGQLQQAVALSRAGLAVDVPLTQYAGGIKYARSAPMWRLNSFDIGLYGSRSGSRALGQVRVWERSGTEDQLYSVPLRVAGASIVGLRGGVSLRPWASGQLTLTCGRERLRYDLYAGRQVQERFTSDVVWSQQLTTTPWALTADASIRAAQRVYKVGLSRLTSRQESRLSVTVVRGRDNGPRDVQLRWTQAITFGKVTETGRSAPSSVSPSGVQTRALLDQVSRRPSFVPAQVAARLDTTVPRERLVAIVRDGLPSGAEIDQHAGTVRLPQAVASILSVTRNGQPFENTGQFAVVGNRLELRAEEMTSPSAGTTDTYVVTLTNSDEGITTVTVVASKGSVRIDQVLVTTGPRQETPDLLQFDTVVGVAMGSLVVSHPVMIGGINVPVPVSITNGEFAIDDGPFTRVPTMIAVGQTLRLRHRAADTFETQTTTTVAVGRARAMFTSITESAPPTPGPLSFPPRVGVRVGDDVTSDAVTVSGLRAPAPVAISGGTYSVDGSPFTADSGTIHNGQALSLRVSAARTPNTTTTATVTVGLLNAEFSVTTEGADEEPDPFELHERTADSGEVVESNPITVTGVNTDVLITISTGTYSINGGSYTTAPNYVGNGDRIVARVVAERTPGGIVTATLSIGTRSEEFVVTTRETTTGTPDTTPNPFSFMTQTDVPRNAAVDSNAIIVSGIDAASPISVAGGQYAVDGGTFTAAPSSVTSGQSVVVRVQSSAEFSTTTSVTLTIGGVSGSFSVTTEAADTTPDSFGFQGQTGVHVGSQVTSNTVTIGGINTAAIITVNGGEYAIHGNAYTTDVGTINSGDSLKLRLTSSPQFSTTTSMTVTVGGMSVTFSATTEAEDTMPDAFSFSPLTNVQIGQSRQSNQIRIDGINAPAVIGVSGEPSSEYRVNGGAWTATPGTVSAGDRVRVRHTAAATGGTTTTTTLTVGGVSGTFSVTTKVGG